MAAAGENLKVVAVGEVAITDSAAALPTVAGRFVTLRAALDNVGNVYIGLSGVTVPDGSTDVTSGYPLDAGEAITLPLEEGLQELYAIAGTSGDHLHYLVEGHPQL